MNSAGAWPGYYVNSWYVEGGKNYENDTPEGYTEIRNVLRDKPSARLCPSASTAPA